MAPHLWSARRIIAPRFAIILMALQKYQRNFRVAVVENALIFNTSISL
jgi:hypothetical protein